MAKQQVLPGRPQRADRERVQRRDAVHRDRGPLRLRDASPPGLVLLPPGARGAQPRDDDGPVPARRRRAGRDPRHQGPADEVRRRRRPVQLALEQEKRVGEEIYKLFELARETKDYRAEQFMQWFVSEQVEEVALMHDLLNVVERSEDNLLLVEEYIAREAPGEDGAAGAPPEAGASAADPGGCSRLMPSAPPKRGDGSSPTSPARSPSSSSGPPAWARPTSCSTTRPPTGSRRRSSGRCRRRTGARSAPSRASRAASGSRRRRSPPPRRDWPRRG